MHPSALLWGLYAIFGQVAIRSLGAVSFKATKIIDRRPSAIKHDRRRLFLFSWHAAQKEVTAPANAPWLRTGLLLNRAATLPKNHGAERAHFPTERRGRV